MGPPMNRAQQDRRIRAKADRLVDIAECLALGTWGQVAEAALRNEAHQLATEHAVAFARIITRRRGGPDG